MTTICPRCFQPNSLRVVGAYVYSAKGVEDSPEFRVEQFDLNTAIINQKLYQCQNCQVHVPEADVRKGQERAERAILWQTSVAGRRIPVVCPLCKNAEHFVVKKLVLAEQDVPVVVMSEAHVKELETVADPKERSSIPLMFVCALETCRGEILINEDAFKVVPIS